jgi:hypothetical protein
MTSFEESRLANECTNDSIGSYLFRGNFFGILCLVTEVFCIWGVTSISLV